MSFFEKDEIGKRIYNRYERAGRKQDGPIAIHKQTRCKHRGFLAVGPLFQGKQDAGLSWFDIMVEPNTPNYIILNKYLREVCNELHLYYQEADEEDLEYDMEFTPLEDRNEQVGEDGAAGPKDGLQDGSSVLA